ncbi:hypothetical protein CCP3SC1AL1_1930004 [Gammaproteobacteria bacterium]
MSLLYISAVDEAISETNLKTYPTSCPWSMNQAIDPGFWPSTSQVVGDQTPL